MTLPLKTQLSPNCDKPQGNEPSKSLPSPGSHDRATRIAKLLDANITAKPRPLIEVFNLGRIYHLEKSRRWIQSKILFSKFNLNVERGEFLGIIGPADSGKTALLQILAGLDPLNQRERKWLLNPQGKVKHLPLVESEGQVLLDGKDLIHLHPFEKTQWIRHHLGCILGVVPLMSDCSSLVNIALPLRISGYSESESEQRARSLLKALQFDENGEKIVARITERQRQFVALARAIANQPKLLLIDSPEVDQIAELPRILHNLRRREGMTILMAGRDEQCKRFMGEPTFTRVIALSKVMEQNYSAPS